MTDNTTTTTTTTTDTADRFRVITLTDSQPVQIRESLWPIIARSEWFEGGYRAQANRKQWLYVRQHADGRILVYGGMDSVMPSEDDIRAGELLWPAQPLVAAIRRVAAAIAHQDHSLDLPNLAPNAIRDLPAVDIDAPTAAAAEDA